MKKNFGGAIVEFALLTPVLFALVALATGVGIVAACQFRLESLCSDTVRQLALSRLESDAELILLAESLLPPLPIKVELTRHHVPVLNLSAPRLSKPLDVLELTLRQDIKGFKLSATRWEPRGRP